MIRVFGATDKTYETNGDVVILPRKARVKNEDNGAFYLELVCGAEYSDYLQSNNIIVVPTPQGEQAFRIGNITRQANKITLKAYHVYYDTQNYIIKDSFAQGVGCNDALEHMNGATDVLSPFNTLSDITKHSSYRCVRKSLAEAITDIIGRWGGHLKRDNWNISILSEIGVDNGITIEYAKNLTELTAEYDWSGVCTKILPVGKDGTLLDEIYMYSTTNYDIPYSKVISFEQDINEEDFANKESYVQALKEDLTTQAGVYLAEHAYPSVNYKLKGNPEKVTDIGDIIEVKDKRIGVDITTRVISYEYDAITEKYTSLEFGNFGKTLNNLVSNINGNTKNDINNAVISLTSSLSEALTVAQAKIWDALGSSYCIYEGDKILIVDKLPQDEAVNVIRINSAGIGFSNTGINGEFTTAWTIDGTFNAQAVNIINLTADLIKGGTLKLGSLLNQSGKIEVYDEANTLICTIDKNGLIMYASNGSYVVLNQDVGLVGYDGAGNPIYWVSDDSFYMSKSVVTQEITLCSKVRFLPMQITENNVVVNDGIGLVSYYEE